MNNLYQITKYIESICKSLPNTGDVYDGSVFQLNEQQNINYPVYVITNRQHLLDRDNETLTYNFAIFAVDRLTSDKENKLDVQSWAIQSLQYIAEKIEDVPALVQLGTIDCFEDRFDSLTAGAYLNLQFNVNAVDCGDNIKMPTGECILQPLRVTENGEYLPIEGTDGFDVVNVNVQPELSTLTCKMGDKYKEYIFDPEDDEGDGWNKVVLDLKLGRANITKNGTYLWKDSDQDAHRLYWGYGDITVDVKPELSTLTCQGGSKRKEYIFDPEDDEGDGWNKVVLDMPMLTAIITENRTIEWKDVDKDAQGHYYGWDKIIVDVPEPVLNPIEIFQNGEYIPIEGADGFNKVVVNVPEPQLIAISKEYNENGNYTIDVPQGYDGISGVEVAVNVNPELEELEVTENGEYYPEKYGYSSVFVDVRPNVTLIEKTITANGGYHYDAQADGFDGYSKVDITVDVPSITTMEITQAEYDALEVKDNNTIYLIKE